MANQTYSLIPVVTAEQWAAFHTLRQKVLFEDRGLFGKYDPNHPDDRKTNNHPVILKHGDKSVGAMRIDIIPEKDFAIMRTVAVMTDQQRRGYGRIMLSFAEEYALQNGCAATVVFSASDAVGFYSKCGYELYSWDSTESLGQGQQMKKLLTKRSNERPSADAAGSRSP